MNCRMNRVLVKLSTRWLVACFAAHAAAVRLAHPSVATSLSRSAPPPPSAPSESPGAC
jgi:hypothetical protein